MVNHKYNTRFKNNLLINYNENNENEKKITKLNNSLQKIKFNKNNTVKNLKINIKNKNKNIKKNINTNSNTNTNNNNLLQKKYYFNKLKRNYSNSSNSSNSSSLNKINLKKKNKYSNNYDFNENKKFNIIINSSNNKNFLDNATKNFLDNEDDEKSFTTEQTEQESNYTLHDSSEDENEEKYNEQEEYKKLSQEQVEQQKIDNENKNLIKEYKNILKTENDSIAYFSKLNLNDKKTLLDKLKDLSEKSTLPIPYEVHIINLDIEEKYKIAAFSKVKNLTNLSKDTSSTEYIKLKNWIDTFTKIPFNNYCSLPITINDGLDKCKEYIINAKKILDESTYGLNDAKVQLLQFIAKLINNPDSNGLVLGIKGPMGTGKTTLIKDGISKILNRPFEFIPLAGIQDGCYFEGHSYTYEGSKQGKIVDILIQSKCMNPIIYGDELDKVSGGFKGDEIIGLLTHLTDVTQASQFNDKYFSELNLNLNKIIYIFSYNDESAINPILRDRMYKIETKGYNIEEKLVIAKKYLIPTISQELNANLNISLNDENIKFIINNFTENEKGVRNLKRCLETIYNKLNLYNLINDNDEFKDTFFKDLNYNDNLNDNIIRKLLSIFDNKDDNIPFGIYN